MEIKKAISLYEERKAVIESSAKNKREKILSFFSISPSLFGEKENYFFEKKNEFLELKKRFNGDKGASDLIVRKFRASLLSFEREELLKNYSIESALKFSEQIPLLAKLANNKFYNNFSYEIFSFPLNAFSIIKFYSLHSLKDSYEILFKSSRKFKPLFIDLDFRISLMHDYLEVFYMYNGIGYPRNPLLPKNFSLMFNPAIIERIASKGVEKETRFFVDPYSSQTLGVKWLENSLHLFNFSILSLYLYPHIGGNEVKVRNMLEEIASSFKDKTLSFFLNVLILNMFGEKLRKENLSFLLVPPSLLK